MKKSVILLMIISACIFIASCVMDSPYYCPYCSTGGIKKQSDGVYKCTNTKCGKEFGAQKR
jgi:ribosomal protein L37AE/L43A